MSGIQSAIGVITGIPIQDTINQLIAISARPRDRLVSRIAAMKSQQVAFTELTALVIGVQLASDNLGRADVHDAVAVSSSNTAALSTRVTGTPGVGTYSFQPVRTARSQQLLSGRIASATEPLGAGTVRLRKGGFVDDPIALDRLNGGEGVQRGQIRITDRSGSSGVIDLRFAKTTRDVVEAINGSSTINVTASLDGDAIRLTDNTGQTVSNLIVQQVGAATTAADLGLSGINVAANTALGNDIVELGSGTSLDLLNDGRGVDFNKSLADIEVNFRDGSAALQIDFADVSDLGDVIDTINAAAPTRLSAALSADGDRIELTDLTVDNGGTFEVTSLFGGRTAEDLGLTGAATGATISGGRLQAGLSGVLLSSLGGGYGLGDLGQISLTDRSGTSAVVDLSSAETLDDVVELINASTVGIDASINAGRNGLLLEDRSGGTGNLIVADGGDGRQTATKLGLVVNDSVGSVDGKSLSRATLGVNTTLASLNKGNGIADGSFTITDSNGAIGAVNTAAAGIETVGDLLDAINGLSIGVEARINDRGDGIELVDTAGGAGTMTLRQSGTATTLADLGWDGVATQIDHGSGPQWTVANSDATEIELLATDTLDDLITKINESGSGVTASKFFDGTGYRLSLSSNESGEAGRMQVELEGLDLEFEEIVRGQDALILVGSADSLGAGILASSSSNVFDQIIDGVELTVLDGATAPVSVNVTRTDSKLKTNMKLFVDQYNKVIDKLATLRSFSTDGSETDPQVKTGILFGSRELLAVERTLSDMMTGRISGAGDLRSLAEVGFDVDEEGKLSFDEAKFDALYASNPNGIRQFFTTEESGVTARFKSEIDRLTGIGDSLLLTKTRTLQARIDSSEERSAAMQQSLDRQRTRLLKQFFTLESTIQKLQSFQTSIDSIQPITTLTSG
ncbi:MAG TPA: flagellar filament capping protein FliD [Pirellulaceae bacterium]|nr:flagellar filament capping protein FliD [Pirellulaceae bacterium]